MVVGVRVGGVRLYRCGGGGAGLNDVRTNINRRSKRADRGTSEAHADGGILTLRKPGSAAVGGPCGTCCTRPFLGLASGPPGRPRWPLWRGRGTL